MRAVVESQADPKYPGRKAYRITGLSREAVQAEITELMNAVEASEHGGFANFIEPARCDAGFLSLGETITYGGEP